MNRRRPLHHKTTNGTKHDSLNGLRLSIPEGDESTAALHQKTTNGTKHDSLNGLRLSIPERDESTSAPTSQDS